MTTKLYDLCVATRNYKDNSGNDKTVWENVGSILENNEGRIYMMLKAHFNPAGISRKEGSESILVSMFVPKNSSGNHGMEANNYDLCVATRSYKDNSGNDKAVWSNVGSILKNKDGKPFMLLKAYFNPAAIQRKEGSESILVSIFTHKSKSENNSDNQDFYSTPDYGTQDYGTQDFSTPDTFQPESYNPNIPF